MAKMSASDFAAKVKERYPEYSSVPDADLVRAIVTKHPEYSDSLDIPSLNQITSRESEANARSQDAAVGAMQPPVMMGFTPRNIARNAMAGGKGVIGGTVALGKDLLYNPNLFESTPERESTMDKFVIDPMMKEGLRAQEDFRHGRISEGLGHGLASGIPLAGPFAASLGEQAGTGDIGGAIGQAGGAYLTGKLAQNAPRIVRATGRGVAGFRSGVKPIAATPVIPKLGGNAADLEPEHINQHEVEITARQPLAPTSLEEGEVSSSPQAENASELPEETIPQTVRFRGEGGRIGKRIENVSPAEPIERFERPNIPVNSEMAAAFRKRASLSDMADRGERYGLSNAADVLEKLEKPYSEYGEDLTSKKFIGPRTMERIGNYERSVVPGEMRGAVPQGTLKFMEDVRSGNIKPIGGSTPETSLEDQLKGSLRLRGIDPDLEQGGHAGNGVVSEEEISRPGRNYVVSKGGNLTYHGKQFAPESIGANQTHVTVLPNGEFRVNAGPELNPAQKLSLKRAQE